jgi:hypothetical protein
VTGSLVRAAALAAAALAVASPRAARGDGAVEELDAGTVPTTSVAPGSRWMSDRLSGIWDASPRWQIRLDASATQLSGGTADTSHGDVELATLSGTYAPDDHWTLRFSGSWSPQSTTHAAVPIDATGAFDNAGAMQATANVVAQSSSLGAGIGVDYDAASGGTHDVSTSVTATATYFSTQQTVTAVMDPDGGMLDPQSLRNQCLSAHSACASDLMDALTPQWVQLGQFAFDASVTDTIARDTDVTMDATYFVYASDPMQFGYFALATVGRSSLGSAAGVAPTQAALSPSVTHRWGGLSATLAGTYAVYVDDQGSDLGGNARVQYKLATTRTQRLKLFAKASLVRHVDETGAPSNAVMAGAGIQYTW